MGTAGSDDFAMKVGPDGRARFEAVAIDRASGRTTLPADPGLPAGSVAAHAPGGSAAVPGLALAGNEGTGAFRPSADPRAFTTAGIEAARIDRARRMFQNATGQVGGPGARPALAGTGAHRMLIAQASNNAKCRSLVLARSRSLDQGGMAAIRSGSTVGDVALHAAAGTGFLTVGAAIRATATATAATGVVRATCCSRRATARALPKGCG